MKNISEAQPVTTGPVCYGLMNDYMFRAVFQKGNYALKRLLSALLNISFDEIVSCEIMNPIILGETIDEKTCILDIRLKLNNSRLINLEMQTGHFDYWTERSLFYLAKMYCNIEKGENYQQIMPAMHIGILAKSPFPEIRQLYSEYLLTNTVNQHIFSKKFSIRMLDLSKINDATEEEQHTELYQWTRLFKATTWEEIRMLSENNEYLQEAVSYLHLLSADEKIRLQCEARERYRMDIASAEYSGIEKGEKIGFERGEKIGFENGEKIGFENGEKIGFENGEKIGFENGEKFGIEQGEHRLSILISKLLETNRFNDIAQVTMDPAFRKKMIDELQL